ncbi:hypothetical protein L7F28_002879, partial [Listeria monocytogenes]|nr:hypothetical protein [Listeria monocytogenes]
MFSIDEKQLKPTEVGTKRIAPVPVPVENRNDISTDVQKIMEKHPVRLKRRKKEVQEKKSYFKGVINKKGIEKVMRIKDYDEMNQVFIMRDDTYVNIFRLDSYNLVDISDAALDEMIADYHKYIKATHSPIKYVTMRFPFNAQEQIEYWKEKYYKSNDPIDHFFIGKTIERLEEMEDNTTDIEYYIFIYGETLQDYVENEKTMKNQLNKSVRVMDIPFNKKRTIL